MPRKERQTGVRRSTRAPQPMRMVNGRLTRLICTCQRLITENFGPTVKCNMCNQEFYIQCLANFDSCKEFYCIYCIDSSRKPTSYAHIQDAECNEKLYCDERYGKKVADKTKKKETF